MPCHHLNAAIYWECGHQPDWLSFHSHHSDGDLRPLQSIVKIGWMFRLKLGHPARLRVKYPGRMIIIWWVIPSVKRRSLGRAARRHRLWDALLRSIFLWKIWKKYQRCSMLSPTPVPISAPLTQKLDKLRPLKWSWFCPTIGRSHRLILKFSKPFWLFSEILTDFAGACVAACRWLIETELISISVCVRRRNWCCVMAVTWQERLLADDRWPMDYAA